MSNDDDTQPSHNTAVIPTVSAEMVAIAELGRSLHGRLDAQDATLESVKNEGQRTGMRMTRVEMRLDDVETRLTRNSGRVKEVSEQDLAQDAQLAQERAAREELAGKVDKLLAIGERLDKLAQKPAVKAIGALITIAIITYAAAHGVTIK